MILSSKPQPNADEDDDALATTLPLKQTTAIFFCQMNEATQITMPYTIAVYMVRDYLGPEASQAQISRLTGILAACFCAAQFLSSIPLGYLSDTYGRKPVVILSNISSLISVLAFGSSPTYLSALLTRMSGGLCNFTFGCLKSMIGESMDLPTQALALGYLSLAWGLGTILGPSLGGALATPCEAYGTGFPLCQPGQLFQIRPFLLPCISAALISFLALQTSMFIMKETLPSKVARKYTRVQQADEEQGVQKVTASNTKGLELSELPAKSTQGSLKATRHVRRGDSAEEMYACSPPAPSAPSHPFAASPRTSAAPQLSPMAGCVGIEMVPHQSLTPSASSDSAPEPATDERPAAMPTSAEDQQSPTAHDSNQPAETSDAAALPEAKQLQDRSHHSRATDTGARGSSDGAAQQTSHQQASDSPRDEQQHRHESDDEHAVLIADREAQCDHVSEQASAADQGTSKKASAAADRQRVWYKERDVQLTILGYGSIAFLYNFADELTPLFAATPPATGGIGLLASQLAVPLVFCGIVLMAYAVYGYPWFQKKYGAKLSCRFGLIATAPFVLLIPVAHYFAWSVLASQLTLCAILGFKSMGATNAFSGSMILVNNAAPRHALGKVNGAGQMVASFVRAIGPAMAGVVWGFTTQLNLPQKQFLPFAFVSLVSLLTQFVYVFVKQCDCSAT